MSRARSATARGASGGSRAAASRPGVFVQTPRSDIFVVLLGVALGAMILGCLLLVLILKGYDFSTKVSALSPQASDQTALAASFEKSDFSTSVRL